MPGGGGGGIGTSFIVWLAISVNFVNQCFQSIDERRDDTEESLDDEEVDDDEDEEGSIEPVITGISDEDEEIMLLMPLRDNPPNK